MLRNTGPDNTQFFLRYVLLNTPFAF